MGLLRAPRYFCPQFDPVRQEKNAEHG